jgi:hypothetical protein
MIRGIICIFVQNVENNRKSRFEHLKHLFTAHPEKYWYVEGRWMYGMYTEDMPGC